MGWVCCEQGMQSKQKYSWIILSMWKVSHSPSWLGLIDHPLHTLDAYMGLRSTLATCAWVRKWGCSVIPEMRLGPFCHGVSGEGIVVAVALHSFHIVNDLLVWVHKKKTSVCLPSWEAEAFISQPFSEWVPLPAAQDQWELPSSYSQTKNKTEKEDAWTPSM